MELSPSFDELMDSGNSAKNNNKMMFVKNNMSPKQTMHLCKTQSGTRELKEMYYNVGSVSKEVGLPVTFQYSYLVVQ